MFKMFKALFALVTGAVTITSEKGLGIYSESLELTGTLVHGANVVTKIEVDAAIAEARAEAQPKRSRKANVTA